VSQAWERLLRCFFRDSGKSAFKQIEEISGIHTYGILRSEEFIDYGGFLGHGVAGLSPNGGSVGGIEFRFRGNGWTLCFMGVFMKLFKHVVLFRSY
jgi:hypothetical protein